MTPLAGVDCLVLGAGGFLGGHLCGALAAAGARVRGFGRAPKFPGAHPIAWTPAEFASEAALAAALDGAELVFHLLGGIDPEVSNRDPLADLQANTLASVRLLELCRAKGVRKVIFVSSGGTVYGLPERLPIAETAATEPISAYGIGKLMVEKYLGLYRHLHGLQTIALRVANPYGPGQSPFRRQGVVPALIETCLRGRPVEIWGDGRVVRDFVYVADVAQAMVLAAGYDGPHPVLNIGSGTGRSLLEVVDAVASSLGRPRPPVLHKPARPADVPVNVLDISLARQALGWTPRTGWAEGLRLTAAWIRSEFPAP